MRFRIPSEFMGVSSEEALRLAESVKPTTPSTAPPAQTIPTPKTDLKDPSNYILLEGRVHGSYSYFDLLVGIHRLGLDTDVQKVSQELGYNVSDTGQEADGTKYIGNINWNQALSINAKLGNVTLNPRQFIDFKELLEQGINGSKQVYDGRGNSITSQKLNATYDEIFTVRNPWRSEWLDAKFAKESNKGLSVIIGLMGKNKYLMQSAHELKNGVLVPATTEALESCVMGDDWIDVASFNSQGLPTKTSTDTKMYFWYPRDGRVAGFNANSGRAYLGCGRNPTLTFSSLGVRVARKKI